MSGFAACGRKGHPARFQDFPLAFCAIRMIAFAPLMNRSINFMP